MSPAWAALRQGALARSLVLLFKLKRHVRDNVTHDHEETVVHSFVFGDDDTPGDFVDTKGRFQPTAALTVDAVHVQTVRAFADIETDCIHGDLKRVLDDVIRHFAVFVLLAVLDSGADRTGAIPFIHKGNDVLLESLSKLEHGEVDSVADKGSPFGFDTDVGRTDVRQETRQRKKGGNVAILNPAVILSGQLESPGVERASRRKRGNLCVTIMGGQRVKRVSHARFVQSGQRLARFTFRLFDVGQHAVGGDDRRISIDLLFKVVPEGAIANRYGDAVIEDDKEEDFLKGICAGTENFGNFFGQNCFMGASGTLLIVSTLTEQGFAVDALSIAANSWPIAVITMVVCFAYYMWYDITLAKKYGKGGTK